VCTGRSTVAQRVRGLRLGVDDWISKPCHPEEVLARVEAVTRRHKRAAAPEETGPLVAGELEIRADQYQAFAGTQSADLTRREFELLHLLAEGHGQVLQREEIYQRVWGYSMARGDRSVDVFIRKIRSKLRPLSPQWSYIHTHFGIGYRFQPEPVGSDPGEARGSLGEREDTAATRGNDEDVGVEGGGPDATLVVAGLQRSA
jgi:DNA-binding response OmpR family regulator